MLYALAAITATAGYAQAPWWAAVAGSCLIALLLFQDEARVYPPPGEEASWDLAESLSNVLIGAGAGARSPVGGFSVFSSKPIPNAP
jgi:hypothetical protein